MGEERDDLADRRDSAADSRDLDARARRVRAAARDDMSSARDRRRRNEADDADAGFPDRFLSGRDVDDATGDRADALADERHAREDRRHAREDRQHADADRARASTAMADVARDATLLEEALEARTVIGQAQGLLMGRHAIGAYEAFQWLVRESQMRHDTLREVARTLVHAAERATPAQHQPDATSSPKRFEGQ